METKVGEKKKKQYSADLQEAIDSEIEEGIAHVHYHVHIRTRQ